MEEAQTSKVEEERPEAASTEEASVRKQLENLNLTLEERSRVSGMDDDELQWKIQDLESIAVCKILTVKYMNPEIFKNMIPKIWHMEGRVV